METYSFGDWLKGRRNQFRLTRQEVADAAHCSVAMLRKIEADERHPSPELAYSLAETMRIPPAKWELFVEAARGQRPLDALVLGEAAVEAAAVPIRSVLPGPLHNLPPQPTPFIGREKELTELKALMNPVSGRLITIVGPGGMGKTRLAVAYAAQFIGEQSPTPQPFPDGIFFANLAPLEEVAHIVPALSESLNFSLEGEERDKRPPRQKILDYLRQQKMLLVMDNFEQLLEGAELVADILQNAPGVQIIATSRERLHLRQEQVYPIAGLAFPEAALSELSESETVIDVADYTAVKLFVQTARRNTPNFEPARAEDLANLANICRLVAGMPLAVELAAAWVDTLSLVEIAAEIQGGFGLLETDMRDVPDRHHSVRATIDYSWQRLTTEEQSLFAQLSVFRGGFTQQAAQAITAASLRLLARLVNNSFLQFSQTRGRYQLHRLMRQFGVEKLAEDKAAERAVHSRHSLYFLNFMAEMEPELNGMKMGTALTEIQTELANIRAAWGWAVEQREVDLLAAALPGVESYFIRSTLFEAGDHFIEAAVAARFPAPFTSLLLSTRTRFYVLLDRIQEATELGKTAVRLAMEGQSWPAEATARQALGWAFYTFGHDFAAAQEQFMMVVELADEIGDAILKASALDLLAGRLIPTKHDEAKEALEKALAIYREHGHVVGEINILRTLTRLMFAGGDFGKALEYAEKGAFLARKSGSRRIEANMLIILGEAHSNRGDFGQAIQIYESCVAILQSLRLTNSIKTHQLNLALLYWRVGNLSAARKLTEEVIAFAQKLNNHLMLCTVLLNYSLLLLRQGDGAAAEREARKALEIAETKGFTELNGFGYTDLGHALLAQERYQEAEAAYGRALTIREELGQHFLAMETRTGLAQLALAKGNLAQAGEQVELILSHLNPDCLAGTEEPMLMYLTCYRVLEANGDERAAAVLVEAHQNLMARASKIKEPDLRRMFLEDIATHREIVARAS
ncbi:MAG TPA: tetratricopeptide repeat protein [Chloroflexota bacterium]|nr:tetratricopeptide repeat protein [Chloroflexota bacterium]HUM67681.1 tetratricopeptide repeat protein [Chloroflexota bacterium]